MVEGVDLWIPSFSALHSAGKVRGHKAGGKQGGTEGEGRRAMRKVRLVSVCPSDEHGSLALWL